MSARRILVSMIIAVLCAFGSTGVSATDLRMNLMPYPMLPEAISSFGATVSDGYLYVFGGHAGRFPGNSADGLSPHFCRINVAQPGEKWESLAMQTSSQSPGLVTWNGSIYRVGGLSFKNKAGDPVVFQSLATFAKYKPDTNAWAELPSLPVPRSSLDAAVVDGKLYVVGGWNLQEGGSDNAVWHDSVLAFDLSNEDGAWVPVAKPPFSTRALAAAGHKHQLYVMGGMNSDNQTTRAVHIYNPSSDSWTAGPELAGRETLSGFAISAFEANGKLYYSGSEGIVYRLSDDDQKWESVERLVFPRSFHRLVVDGDRVVAVAGVARGGGYLANLEIVDVSNVSTISKAVEWSIPFQGDVKQGQALLLNGSSLYAFGGNRSREPHNFSRESFVSEAYRFDLASRSVERLDDLPTPTQGGVANLFGERIDQSIYVTGGLSHQGEKFASADTVFQYRLRSKRWMEEVGKIPTTRAMFSSATSQGNIWAFGGSRVNTSDKGLIAETWQWKPGSGEPFSVLPDANIPTPRRSFGATVLNDQFYAVGGLGDSQIVETVDVFDFGSRKWSSTAAPKTPRVFPSLAAAGGRLYLSGGFTRIDGHFAPAKSVEVYDPQSITWQIAFENLPFAERAGTMLEFQDRLLFYGIDSKDDGVAHFVVLDPLPATVGFGKTTNPIEERSDSSDLLVRLMRMDKDRDGRLSKEEVGERFRAIIIKADVDQDGFATKAELEAAVKAGQPAERGRTRTQ